MLVFHAEFYSGSYQPYSVITVLFSWGYSRGQASFVSARENFQNLSGKPHHFFSCMTWWFIVITLKWPLSGAVSWIHQNLAGTFFHQKRQMTQRSIHFPIFFTPSRSNLLCFLSTAPHHQNKHFDKSLDVLKRTDFLCLDGHVFQKKKEAKCKHLNACLRGIITS